MNREKVISLLKAAALGESTTDFSSSSVNEAAILALAEYTGHNPEQGIRRMSPEDFAIVEEVLEELTPKALEDVIGQFAEIKTYGRNEQIMFAVKNIGGTRVMQAIVPGARAGIYQARRIDNRHLTIDSNVETVAYALSLEDILTGRVTMADYVTMVTQGFVEIVYARMIQALRTAAALAPIANRASVTGVADNLPALDRVIRVVSAYGTPTIFTFDSLASELHNTGMVEFAPSRSSQDLADIRDYGRVLKYKGTNIVVLPNFLVDNTNTRWVYKENEMFVLPVNEKPIKVGFRGNLYIAPVHIPSGGEEWHAHRELGVAVLANNSIGSVTDANLTDDNGVM